jgi:hypothetical protein
MGMPDSIGFQLIRHWAKQDFKGWDPYDMLNSKVIRTIVPDKSHFLLWVVIQLGKVLPVNIRRILLVPKTHNAKGIALFISGICNYWYINKERRPELKVYLDRLVLILSELKDPSINAWGYGFLWVARGGLRFPEGTPNVVVSYYVYSALESLSNLDEYSPPVDIDDWIFSLDLLRVLRRTEFDEGPLFSYSAYEGNEGVFNASLFASLIFAKSSKILDEADRKFVIKSIKAVENSIQDDGSIVYGQKSFQNWIDNHHTLYIIEAALRLNCETDISFDKEKLTKAIVFYKNNFIRDKRFPLFLKKKYVFDFHALGQLLRMSEFGIYNSSEIQEVLTNWIGYFKKSRFPYRIYKCRINRVNYVRWTQAFMFYGLSYYDRYGKD